MRLTFVWLLSALVTPSWGCAEAPAHAASSNPPRLVTVGGAQRATRTIVTEVVGTVRAVRRATIAPLISGNIVEVRAGLGSSVRTGEVLARLSDREVTARLEQTRAAAALAQRERERAESLRGQQVISVAQYDAALAEWNMAQARQAEASTIAEHAVLRAPFAGVITAQLAHTGDTALPGQALFELEAPGALRFEARGPEASVGALELGQSLPVRLDGLAHDLVGTIAEIQPASDDATRTRLIKLDLPKTPGLRSGRFGRLLLATGASLAVSVPAGAVVRQGQLEGVFVVNEGVARLRLVRTGRAQDERLEISSGLSQSERIVLHDAAQLRDGQRVEVAR
ncbi:MAG: Multidrug resistance protein MexA precursor [Pseudomonadota bacterium]|jgi:RND family efflux transporter MFP subunit